MTKKSNRLKFNLLKYSTNSMGFYVAISFLWSLGALFSFFEVKWQNHFWVTLAMAQILFAIRFYRNHRQKRQTELFHRHHFQAAVEPTLLRINQITDTLSSASTSTAASLEQTVASLEELSSMVQMNSENAKQAASLAQAATESVTLSEQETAALLSVMQKVEESSKQIGAITKTIDDLAFQTNLLALNAAVEAARAGEHGKGFAVVAEAVRALAQKSATSARDIGGLISKSSETVTLGVNAATETAQKLSQVSSSIRKVNDLNMEIATASTEQATGIQQISKAMNQIDSSTQQNASASTQMVEDVKLMNVETSAYFAEMLKTNSAVAVQTAPRRSTPAAKKANSGWFSAFKLKTKGIGLVLGKRKPAIKGIKPSKAAVTSKPVLNVKKESPALKVVKTETHQDTKPSAAHAPTPPPTHVPKPVNAAKSAAELIPFDDDPTPPSFGQPKGF